MRCVSDDGWSLSGFLLDLRIAVARVHSAERSGWRYILSILYINLDGCASEAVDGGSWMEDKMQCHEADVLNRVFMNARTVVESCLQAFHVAGDIGIARQPALVDAFAVQLEPMIRSIGVSYSGWNVGEITISCWSLLRRDGLAIGESLSLASVPARPCATDPGSHSLAKYSYSRRQTCGLVT